MTLTTEIFIFESSDVYRNNPRLLFPAFNIALKSQGAHPPAYYGKDIENPCTAFALLDWDSYEAHAAVMDSPSYPVLLETITPCLSDTRVSEMYHVRFSAPTTAFQQPVTEVLILTLKAPENRATVVKILSKISEESGKSQVIFGETREDENKFFVVGGWQTSKENLEAIAKPEVFDELYSLVSKDHNYHINLSQYRL